MEERASVAVAPARYPAPSGPIHVAWLGRVAYRDAWDLQRRLAAARAGGRIEDQLLLVEHEAVVTLGRNADHSSVRATPAELAARGIEVIEVERGGGATYHGPGQLVGYPIVALHARGLLVRPFVRALEDALIGTCAALGVDARRRTGYPGCWCGSETELALPAGAAMPDVRKIGALGLRVERGVTYHGIALNVTVALDDFDLIDPCGLPGVTSTSIAREAGWPDVASRPSTESVGVAASAFAAALGAALGSALDGDLPPAGDPAGARASLERLLLDR